MTEVSIARFHRGPPGPAKSILARCRTATSYLEDNSLVVLKNEKGTDWFLYNDDADSDVRVVVRFRLLRSDVEAFRRRSGLPEFSSALPITCPISGHTAVCEIKERQGQSAKHVYVRAVATVYAQQTIPFLFFDEAVHAVETVFDFEKEPAGLELRHTPFYGRRARGARDSGSSGPDADLTQRCRRVYPCFREEDNTSEELLYRLVCDGSAGDTQGERTKAEVWAFYNASADYNVTVHAAFANAEEVRALGRTRAVSTDGEGGPQKQTSRVSHVEDSEAAWIANTQGSGTAVRLQLTVPPLSSEPFMEGTLTALPELSFVATATSNEVPEYDAVHFRATGPDANTVDYDQLFKCYPDKGNGLLFRLVDTAGKRWAFYNDTEKYNFTITAVFPPGDDEELFELGPTASLSVAPPQPSSRRASSLSHLTPRGRDSEGGGRRRYSKKANTPGRTTQAPSYTPHPPGSRVVTMTIPPGETRLFLHGGTPARYQLIYQKERITVRRGEHSTFSDSAEEDGEEFLFDDGSSVDEDEQPFSGDGPDKKVFRYGRVLRTPDAHVYRLVSENGDAWGFYNDSRTSDAFVAVKFTGIRGAFGQDLTPGVVPLGQARLLRVQRSADTATHLELTTSSGFPSRAATPADGSRLRHRSREAAPVTTPGRARMGERSGTSSACHSPRGEGAAVAASFCPEVYVSVGCGATMAFAKAVKPHAMRRYLLFIRADPPPTEHRGASTGVAPREGAAKIIYAHASAAAAMKSLARPDRVKPCFSDMEKNPLLFHLEESIPSPTLAAARERQQRSATTASDGKDVLLTESEEEAFLQSRPMRWCLFNDSDKYCFIATYHLDGRSDVKALGHTQIRQVPAAGDDSGVGLLTTHSALSARPSSGSQASTLTETPGGARNFVVPLDLNSPDKKARHTPHTTSTSSSAGRQGRDGSLPEVALMAMRSPLDRTIDEVCYQDFALENSYRQQAAREGSASAVTLCTAVVGPLKTVEVLEGEIVGGSKLTVRVDEARENRLVTFNNGQPHIYTSEAQFLARSKADASAVPDSIQPTPQEGGTSASVRDADEGYYENMLESAQLRFYRLMPKQLNGLLFRIVDDASRLWSFFNDTANYCFTVRVLFFKGSRVKVVGHAVDVTERERREAQRRQPLVNDAGLPQRQHQLRRLSESRQRAADASAEDDSSFADQAARLNFFTDPAIAADETARIVEVVVDPGDTELLVHATDVVRFRISWYATPLRVSSATSKS